MSVRGKKPVPSKKGEAVPVYPLCFEPVYQPYIWGGDRIVRRFKRDEPDGVYAESWEIADRPEGMSHVTNGPLKGQSLRELVRRMGSKLVGEGRRDKVFPLLIKLIDARETLSVQVHPNDESAREHGGEPKTEMWYVIDAEPDACVYAGLKPGTDRTSFKQAIRDGSLEDLLTIVPVQAGDAIYMPGGRVHAIGAGCLLLEVQQNSNTTYRLYDWGRVGSDGRPRELHVDQALKVIRWRDVAPPKVAPRRIGRIDRNELWEVVSSPYFRMERLDLQEAWHGGGDGQTFHVLFVRDGRARLSWEGGRIDLRPGTSCLVPAALLQYQLKPLRGRATVIRVTRP